MRPIDRKTWKLFGIGLVIALVAVAIQITLPLANPPKLIIGSAPEDYHMPDMVEDGDKVDLGATGPARIGGTTGKDTELVDVVVSAGGESAHAIFDRSVDPPVWWVFAAPPESGPAEFTITGTGVDGSTTTETITLDFELPAPGDVVIHPEVIALGGSGDLELVSWDAGTGVVGVVGAEPGMIHLGTILSSDGANGVAEQGLLRRVTGFSGDARLMRVQTEAISLDDAILQASFGLDDAEAGGGHGRSVLGRNSNRNRSKANMRIGSIGFGMSPGTTATEALDDFGKCKADCTSKDPIRLDLKAQAPEGTAGESPAAMDMTLEFTMAATVDVGLDIDIGWDWRWFVPHPKGHIETSIALDGTHAERLTLGRPVGREDIDLDKIAAAAAPANLFKAEGRKSLYKQSFYTLSINFFIGPIWVNFVPQVEIEATWNAKLAGNTNLSMANEFSLAGGVKWENGSAQAIKDNQKGERDARIGVGLAGTARTELTLSASLLAYDGFGPRITTQLRADAKVALVIDSNDGAQGSLSLTIDLIVRAGVLGEVPIIKIKLFEFDVTIIELRLAEFTISPGEVGREPGLPAPPERPPPLDPVRSTDLAIMLVLDTSGSMNDPDPNGVIKIDGAKQAIRTWLNTLPPSVQMGLRSYPDSSCDAGTRIHPVGPLDARAMQDEINSLTASGDTPTAAALRAAFDDLPPNGNRTIVLVSDGESNCGDPPCDVARELGGHGIEVRTDFTINAIGFQISDVGAEELRCIAEATGGHFTTVDDSEDLNKRLEDLSGPVLTIELEAPDTIRADTLGRPLEPVTVVARVKNAGAEPATDVLVSLDADPSLAGIADKIRPVGTIQPGSSTTVEWPVRIIDTGQNHDIEFTARAALLEDRPGDAVERSRTVGVVVEEGDRVDQVGAVLRAANRIVVMGDSFSAGEGTRNYLPGTDAKPSEKTGNTCHRSNDTYTKNFFEERIILACSAAITRDLLSSPKKHKEVDGTGYLPSQVDQLQALKGPVDAVFMSMGGNDVHFSKIAATCVLFHDCSPPTVCYSITGGPETCVDNKNASDLFEDGVRGLEDALVEGYLAIDKVLNRDAARAEREGRQAPIVIMPYPKLFPTSIDRQNGCVLGVSAQEMRAANRIVERLNNAVRNAVARARVERLPVYFAASVERAFQADPTTDEPSHTLCDPDPYANNLDITPSAKVIATESLHPNVLGYEAMTSRMLDDARGWQVLPDRGRRSSPPPRHFEGKVRSLDSTIAAGSRATVEGSGFAPGTLVTAQIASRAITVGATRADESGNVTVTIDVPVWTEIGDHHMLLSGLDEDGRMRVMQQPLEVTGRRPSQWWWPSGTFALTALGAAWVVRWRSRRRRPEQALEEA